MARLSLNPPSWYGNHLETGAQWDTKRYMWKLKNCMKCNELCKLLYYDIVALVCRGERQYLAMEGNGSNGYVLSGRC